MKFFKQREILPVDKQTYLKHLLFLLLLQFLLAVLMYSLIYFCEIGTSDFTKSYYFFGSTIIINFIVDILFTKSHIFQGRYKDIFPNHKFSGAQLIIAMFVPLFFIGFILYLYFKKKSPDNVPPAYLSKLRYSIPLSLVIVALQVFSPKSAYWSSSPSTYYVIDIAHDAYDVIKFKESTKEGSTVIQDYENLYGGKFSSTQLVLLTAVGAAHIIKEKQRAVANEQNKLELSLKSGIKMLNVGYATILKSESTKFEIWDFSPFHWLYPTGPTEIMLISLIEFEIIQKFNKVLIEKNSGILKNLENRLVELPKNKREEYRTQLSNLRKKFENTQTFRSIASVNK